MKLKLFCNNVHYILVRDDVAEANTLWNMSRTSSPHQGILERFLQSSVYLIANIFYTRATSDDQSFREIGVNSFPVFLSAMMSTFRGNDNYVVKDVFAYRFV